MKHIIFILLIFVCQFTFAAPRDCLIVHFADGSYVVFPLEQSPRVSFDGGVVQIADKRYQVSNVRKYTIGDSENTGIKSVDNGGTSRPYDFDGKNIILKLANPSQNVSLHTVNGVEIPVNVKPDMQGNIRIPLPQTPDQVFLLTIGNETIKIRRP